MIKTIAIFLISGLLFCSCRKDSGYTNNPGISNDLHNKPTGSSAKDILTSSKYTSLKIEVQYMAGFVPDPAALAHLQNMIASVANKPAGITILTKEIPAIAKQTLTGGDVLEIEKVNRTVFTSGSELALYILYTNGNYIESNVLGIAYRNTSVALFGKKIADNSGGIGQPSRTKLVATVSEHELGHLMGLVDLGTPMQSAHKDAARGNHCNSSNCIMYYASETSDILGFLITGNIPSLDANCRADLKANGGL